MNFRLSRITQHNKNQETDQLYDPLRDTLRKSSASRGKSQGRPSGSRQLRGSSVSKRIRQLSPSQADQIQTITYIPYDKRLKPTDNITRVAGKQFFAVDVKEKVRPTLSQQQFDRTYKGERVEKIVYEVGFSTVSSKEPSPFNLRSRPQFSVVQNKNYQEGAKANNEEEDEIAKDKNKDKRQNKKDKVVAFKETAEELNKPAIRYSTDSLVKNLTSQRESVEAGKDYKKNGETSIREGSNREGSKKEGSKEGKLFINAEVSGKGGSFNEYGNSQVEVGGNYKGVERISKETDEKQSKTKPNCKNEPKKTYRYNLFSGLDEAVNTKCASFGKNELIASKPTQAWE